MSGNIKPKTKPVETLEKALSGEIELKPEDWLRTIAEALVELCKSHDSNLLETRNIKDAMNNLSTRCGRVLDGMPPDPWKWIPRPSDKELFTPQKSPQPAQQTRSDAPRFDRFRPCDKVRFPSLSADEYAHVEGAPQNILAMARERAVVDGWRYWVSTTGKYIYRKQA